MTAMAGIQQGYQIRLSTSCATNNKQLEIFLYLLAAFIRIYQDFFQRIPGQESKDHKYIIASQEQVCEKYRKMEERALEFELKEDENFGMAIGLYLQQFFWLDYSERKINAEQYLGCYI